MPNDWYRLMLRKIIAVLLVGAAALCTACQPLDMIVGALSEHGDTVDIVPSPTSSPTPKPTQTQFAEETAKDSPEPVRTHDADAAGTPTEKPKIGSGEKLVALTFDDGPYKNVTPRILDVVEKYADFGVHVTFFVLGLQAVQYPEIVARAASLGCEIGNHTYHHKNLTKLSVEEMQSEVNDLSEMITELTDTQPTLVRPPYGARNDVVYANVPYPLILWDVDTLDWSTHDTASTVEAALKCEDGDIILMHDVHEDTAAAAEEIIPRLIDMGFRLVTVSEMFEAKGLPLEAGHAYRRAR